MPSLAAAVVGFICWLTPRSLSSCHPLACTDEYPPSLPAPQPSGGEGVRRHGDQVARHWAERFPRVRLEVIDVDEQDQRRVLTDGQVELCFVRLPIDDDGLHLIRLYDELPVAWVSKDHLA